MLPAFHSCDPKRHYEEKRYDRRLQIDHIARLTDPDHEIFCKNISGSGILFESIYPLAVRHCAEMILHTPSSLIQPLSISIQVVRTVSIPGTQRYSIAAKRLN
jgi:hypothetical protein